jgi:uncharacterized protein (TIGR02598 family)
MKAALITYLPPASQHPATLSRVRSHFSRAFSLVEVVLALGLMSFALMGIVGLLRVGLSHFRKAIDLTVQAQIAQELTSMIQRTPYADIDNLGGPATYYYDEEGNPVDQSRYVYTATAEVASDSELNGLLAPTWTIGDSGKALTNVKAVKIIITNQAFPANSQTLTTYVANSGI